jgi:hypothetical protein
MDESEDYSEEYAKAKETNITNGFIVEDTLPYKAKLNGQWYHTDLFGEVLTMNDLPIDQYDCICHAWYANECVCGAWDLLEDSK